MGLQCTNAIVTIATANFDKLVTFYTHLLTQNPINLIPNVYAEFQFPGMTLGIFYPKKTENHQFHQVANSQMSLCLEVSNLETAIAHITNLGYPPPGEIAVASHGREIYAYDPDGNRLILHQSHQVKR